MPAMQPASRSSAPRARPPHRPFGLLRSRLIALGASSFLWLAAACDAEPSAMNDAGRLDGGGVDGGAATDSGGPRVGVDAGSMSDAGPALDAGPRADGGVGSSTLAELLDRELFATLFPHKNDSACEGDVLTYDALLAAAVRFPAFASEGSDDVRRRELAAFLGNTSHETTGGWPTAPDGPFAWGLCFVEEVGCGGGGCTGYCDPGAHPCAAGQTYHGRGPMQLSWNYNYAQAGAALGLDLIADPGLVARDGEVGWLTALWFWMTPQSPKPSAHDVMVGAWTPSSADTAGNRRPGFGMTVNIINGGLECGIPGDARVLDRIGFFERYCNLLGVGPGPNLDCADMASY